MAGNIRKVLPHNNNVICDVCGRKRKRTECTLAYGSGTIPIIMSCLDGCADELQPLNYPPPVIIDARPVPDARPTVYTNQPQFNYEYVPSRYTWGHFNFGVWGAFNGLNNSFSTSPVLTWGNF